MISRILAYVLVAVSAAGFMYWQHTRIGHYKTQATIANGQLEALRDVRKNDQKRIDRYTGRVARVQTERNKLARDVQEMTDDEILDFLSTPIPAGLAARLRDYLQQRKAPGDQD